MTWLFPLIGALSNWLIRGGGLEPFIGRNIPGGRWIHASIYGICFALASGYWLLGVAAAGLMALGQAPAWGDYIKKIMDGETIRGILLLSVRGAFWGACLAFMGVPVQSGLYAFLCVAAGLTMGPVYWIMWRLVGHANNRAFNHWTCSEQLLGFLTWLPLVILRKFIL